MEIQPVSSENWKKFEDLFSSCEQCQDCWCLNHRVSPDEELTGDPAKLKMKMMVDQGQVGGLVGIIDGQAVSWLSVDSTPTQIGHDYLLETKDLLNDSSWMIHCVFVHKDLRGKGLSKKMVAAGIEYARSKGAKSILSFPIPEETRSQFPKDDAEFSGRLSTYRGLGFEAQNKLHDFYQVMELKL